MPRKFTPPFGRVVFQGQKVRITISERLEVWRANLNDVVNEAKRQRKRMMRLKTVYPSRFIAIEI